MTQVSITKRDDLKLMYVQASSFPDGIKEAWDKLESPLASLRGRKFYGVTRLVDGVMEYRACVIPLDDSEPLRLGFATFTVPSGYYATKKLVNWASQTHLIKIIFEELRSQHSLDPNRPHIEFYRSQKEVVLMAPIIHMK
jgi:hypothetical protein